MTTATTLLAALALVCAPGGAYAACSGYPDRVCAGLLGIGVLAGVIAWVLAIVSGVLVWI